MSWLSSLPHQIPFRAASTGRRVDESTIEGEFLCTLDDALAPAPFALGLMLVEAMAQLGGGLVFSAAQQGFLSGVDGCELHGTIEAGDVVRFFVKLEATFGSLYKFSGRGSVDGVDRIQAKFYLAGSDAPA